MRRRTAMAWASLTLTVAVIGASTSVGAAPADIPWYERPVTVGTGFRTAPAGSVADASVVSGTGRWVAFTSTATDLLPDGLGAGTFLRDRWTDTTVRIGSDALRRIRPTVMSQDGLLVGGLADDPNHGPGIAWLYDQRTRRFTDVPVAPGAAGSELVGVNNDGYVLVRDVPGATGTATLTRTGRLGRDGVLSPLTVAARGSRRFVVATSSLQYALAVVGGTGGAPLDVAHVRLTDGALTSFRQAFPAAGGALAPNRSVAVSPDGSVVAMAWVVPDHQAVRVWDVTAGRFVDHLVPDGYDGRPVALRGVTDDGRIVYDTTAGTVMFADPLVHPERADRVLNVRFDDRAPAPIVFDDARPSGGLVAIDIDRVLICTRVSMSSFAPALATNCFLVPIPPSPLAAG